MKLRALLTGFFTETNTYVKAGTMDSFNRTAGQEIIDQNRDTNTNFGAYIKYCEEHDIDVVPCVYKGKLKTDAAPGKAIRRPVTQ